MNALNEKLDYSRNLLYGTLANVEECINGLEKYPFLQVSAPMKSRCTGNLQRALIVDFAVMEEYVESLQPVKKTAKKAK